jgi:phosphohistidine phosphatase SixA
LYFRHSEREEWPLVSVYDYFDVAESSDGRQESFASAVCLTERGKEDARLIGRVFDTVGIPVEKVMSSPSCRARETANLAFGQIDEIDRSILHPGAVASSQTEDFGTGLLDLLSRNSPQYGDRVVVVGHGSTLNVHTAILFPDFKGDWVKTDQSGFYLIEIIDGEMVLRWTFVDFSDFAQELLVY